MSNKTKVIIITGPTGVGKTKISLEVAKMLNTDIINGDAFQIYDQMFIGTASPTIEEKKEVNHLLFNILPPTSEFSVCDYQKLVREKIEEVSKLNKIPLIVGGSGLYLDSVIADYRFDTPKHEVINEEKYQDLTNEKLYQILLNLKPDVDSNVIHMNNRKRVIRAIENLKSDNYSTELRKNELLYDALVIFLSPVDRNVLYKRINLRVDQMKEEGLIEEVRYLYQNNLFSKTSIQAIGYKELIPYFENQSDLNTCLELIKQSSRHYAKRQITWFKHKPYAKFIDVNYDCINKTIEEIKNIILEFIK